MTSVLQYCQYRKLPHWGTHVHMLCHVDLFEYFSKMRLLIIVGLGKEFTMTPYGMSHTSSFSGQKDRKYQSQFYVGVFTLSLKDPDGPVILFS